MSRNTNRVLVTLEIETELTTDNFRSELNNDLVGMRRKEIMKNFKAVVVSQHEGNTIEN